MRAAILVAPGQIELREVAMPEAQPGGVVVRVRAALTDGTDLKAYRRGHPQMPMPTRFGHEFAGDVAAAGAGVAAFVAGDPIMCVHSAPCGACFWCDAGEEELCERLMSTKILGAYAEFIAVPAQIVARNAFHKPAALSYAAAAFLEPLACVVHSLTMLDPKPGSTLAIVGDGGFGILHALVARALGLPDPILVGRRAERLQVARALGFADAIDATSADVRARVLERTGGRGADAAIETTGTAAVWESVPGYVRRGGTVVLFGGLPGGTRVAYDAARLHYDEVRLLSPFHFAPRSVRRAYELLASGAVGVLPLVSASRPLDELAATFAALDAGHGMKYAVIP
ncbi:MAG: zinc-dependent alcohol dehydrogenase [Vulcanimicrobiaceae bacterium]